MTNFGPLIVHYRWTFVLEKNNIVFNSNQQQQKIKEKTQASQIITARQTEEVDRSQQSEFLIEYPESERLEKQEKIDTFDNVSQISMLQKNKNQFHELELPSVEEVFDISPLYGSLDPGQSQELNITFYGHKDLKAFIKAICHINNGPTYEMVIKGEASVLNYELSNKLIDFGCIVIKKINLSSTAI